MKKQKKGISLIVLVITIIVMIILAATVIISLTDNNIIGSANKAVKESNLKEVQAAASMGWMEAYTNVQATEAQRKSDEYYETYVKNYLVENNINADKFVVSVSASGADVLKGWKYKKDASGKNTLVTNGEIDIPLGDTIAYTPTGVVSNYAGGWYVLGASKRGELLIISKTLIDNSTTLCGYDAYLNVENILDSKCTPYGTGLKATGARSVRIEDIDNITGYNPNNTSVYDADKTGVGTKYNVSIKEYGNELTYTWQGENYFPAYVGTNGNSSNLITAHSSGFKWYDYRTSSFKLSPAATSGTIAVMKNTEYMYNFATYNMGGSNVIGIAQDSKASIMLTNPLGYLLASKCIIGDPTFAMYDVYKVSGSSVQSIIVASSYHENSNSAIGVRAVVSLAPDVVLTGNSTSGWTYN